MGYLFMIYFTEHLQSVTSMGYLFVGYFDGLDLCDFFNENMFNCGLPSWVTAGLLN